MLHFNTPPMIKITDGRIPRGPDCTTKVPLGISSQIDSKSSLARWSELSRLNQRFTTKTFRYQNKIGRIEAPVEHDSLPFKRASCSGLLKGRPTGLSQEPHQRRA